MRTLLSVLALGLFLLSALRPACADTYVRFNTDLGYIDVDLFSSTPNTMANFLSYVDDGGYNFSIIHRTYNLSDSNGNLTIPCVIQGGGFTLPNGVYPPITAIAPPANPLLSEAGISNTRGTIAMALTSAGKDSATNQWFFNEADNSGLWDGSENGGPFTVFGTIMNASGLSVMDQIGSLPFYDASSYFTQLFGAAIGGNFGDLPLINYNSTTGLVTQNFVIIYSITPLTVQAFSDWQTGPTSKFTPQQQTMPAFIAPTATPWNDGVPNLLKYLCNINPSAPMSAADRAKLPTAGKTTISGTKYLTLTYHQNTALEGATVNVQTSPDLHTWTTVTQPTFVFTGTDSSGDPILRIQVAAPANGTKQFIRLNVVQS